MTRLREKLPDLRQGVRSSAGIHRVRRIPDVVRDGDVHIPHLSMEEPLRAELRHFLDCVESGANPDSGLDAGLRITANSVAAERSLALGGASLPIEM